MKAPNKLKITVTKKLIAKGRPYDNHFCPIACAVRAKGFKNINVDQDTIQIGRTGHGAKVYELPQIAQDFIGDFDYNEYSRQRCRPISFVATLDQDYL